MTRRLIKPIIVLPGVVLVIVPAVLLWLSRETAYQSIPASRTDLHLWLGLGCGVLGLALMIWTVRILVVHGHGTPAPWDPPQRLVVRGPYRHVRNPMITGVLLFLVAETLAFQSWPIAAWTVVFLIANMIYFPLSEERQLEARFGDEYRRYKENVPRWIPRVEPWTPPDET